MREDWPKRLRQAVDETNKKHSYIAEQAGMAPATLSRVLNDRIANPGFELVVAVAQQTRRSVAWIIGEADSQLLAYERSTLLDAAEIILKSEGWRVEYDSGIARMRQEK